MIEDLPSCRFYASSLLIIYDGSLFETSNDLDIKIIDFANCVTNAHLLYDSNSNTSLTEALPPDAVRVPCPPTTRGPDQGYLLGLRTLIRNFEELYRELGGLSTSGHVVKESLAKSTRLTAEVGLVDSIGGTPDPDSYRTSPLLPKKTESSEMAMESLHL